MDKVKWTGNFVYKASVREETHSTMNGMKPDFQEVDFSRSVPISLFSIGAGEPIDLTSDWSTSLTSTFYLARKSKTIRLYLPLWISDGNGSYHIDELWRIASSRRYFSITIAVTCQIGITITQNIMFGSRSAKLVERPKTMQHSNGNEYLVPNLTFLNSEYFFVPKGGGTPMKGEKYNVDW